MTDIGLVSVLPRPVFVLLAVLTTSFVLSLRRRPLRTLVPLCHLIVLIVLLYGVTAFLETEARFSSTYRHAGIVDYIQQNGSVNPNIDAYFNWPGFFGFGALLGNVAGLDSALSIAAWAPLFLNLFVVAPMHAIFRWATDDARVVWAALWLFFSANWVGQDYFSPQGLGFALWMSMLALLLTYFTPRTAPLLSRLSRKAVRETWSRLRETQREPIPTPEGSGTQSWQLAGILLIVVVVYAALVTGHQLTPTPALLTVTGLVVLAGLRTRRLPILMFIMLASWVSYMTTRYLAGHASVVLKPVGDVSSNLSQSVGSRYGGSELHRFVVHFRVQTSLLIWSLAFLGGIRRVRNRYLDVALLVVAVAPFALPIVQPYGGEILLRVFLFTLPAVAFFIACLVFPTVARGRRWLATVSMIVLCCLLLGAFQVTRYGNERQDYFTTGDAATVEALYRLAPVGSTVVAGNQNLPWRGQHYVDYHYDDITNLDHWKADDDDPQGLLADIRISWPRTGAYVIVTRSTEVFAGLYYGRPAVLGDLVDALASTPDVQTLYRSPDGSIFFIPPQPRENP
jgi:hypothetical protein